MRECRVCRQLIMDDGYIHEYYFGGTLKLEETHNGICAEEFKERIEEVLCESIEDDQVLTEKMEDLFEGYQIL